ncbi:rhomboid family intramembrane serine protease [Prosthecochloris sp. N3]|uniref:Rhomboid family intramembrane serine protease n=1 Tax=Prosthecochloris ethylica TaxID=2743976 RepID=A0ABR9XR64_9CHLB|nr:MULTISPECIES: rhomboid family intramembrane serine protease [Prosthecochloris]MBF0586087.1 rhomboid family intramembrane serine protease [Prosthecochloris ethylica]MBF0636513.1 rhomboid family intramembrane serine protease [Prosthecochloris ethylica]NUK47145.1 rhomboid family intramembrane serine protease [Prosthecochloris ethylica]RNA65689.1 rhomboid family intramembrane serine protease [Prosthecochloris sp. ZM_2]
MSYSTEPYSPGGFQMMPPAIKAIILTNVAVFLLQFLTPLGNFLFLFGALWPIGSGNDAGLSFQIWQPVSYMFMHGGLAHILFNMFALWLFGTEIENYWGTKEFTTFYFVCGIGAALVNLATTIGSPYPTVGASGAVFGILLAFGMMFPDRYIFLYFLFPVKAKYFVAGYAAIELLMGLNNAGMGSQSNIAHFAHLGGMAVGFAYIKFRQQGWSLSDWIDNTFPKKDDSTTGGPTIYRGGSSGEEVSEAEIDAILDKISQSGYQSLTDDEKHKLLKAGGRK